MSPDVGTTQDTLMQPTNRRNRIDALDGFPEGLGEGGQNAKKIVKPPDPKSFKIYDLG